LPDGATQTTNKKERDMKQYTLSDVVIAVLLDIPIPPVAMALTLSILPFIWDWFVLKYQG
jgi:hypothetical protein